STFFFGSLSYLPSIPFPYTTLFRSRVPSSASPRNTSPNPPRPRDRRSRYPPTVRGRASCVWGSSTARLSFVDLDCFAASIRFEEGSIVSACHRPLSPGARSRFGCSGSTTVTSSDPDRVITTQNPFDEVRTEGTEPGGGPDAFVRGHFIVSNLLPVVVIGQHGGTEPVTHGLGASITQRHLDVLAATEFKIGR